MTNVDLQTYAGDPRTVASVETAETYRYVKADIRDGAAIRSIIHEARPDAIIHLAAETHVDRSIQSPDEFVSTNVMGTATVLAAAREYLGSNNATPADFRFIHVSTDEVFGSLRSGDKPFTPSSRYDPRSPYSASKAASDHLARAWFHTYDLPVIVTNCSNNYGPFQFPEKLVPLMIIAALGGQDLPLYGTGENVRDWLHVDDHAQGLLLTAAGGEPGETYLFGGGAERTNLEVVYQICDLIDEMADSYPKQRRDLVRFVADRPGHDYRYAIDYSLTEQTLGWAPTQTFEDGLRATVRWYLSNSTFWQSLLHTNRSFQDLGSTS